MINIKDILDRVDRETANMVVALKDNYELEIKVLKGQIGRKEPSTNERISRAYHHVKCTLKKYDKCTLFYNKQTGKFRVITQKMIAAKESVFSDAVGVYEKGFDEDKLLNDICKCLKDSLK